MNVRAPMDSVDFNLNDSQKLKFNEIYDETSKLYPHLCADEFQRHRTKVLIAHSILYDDKKIFGEENDNIKEVVIIEEPQGTNEE